MQLLMSTILYLLCAIVGCKDDPLEIRFVTSAVNFAWHHGACAYCRVNFAGRHVLVRDVSGAPVFVGLCRSSRLYLLSNDRIYRWIFTGVSYLLHGVFGPRNREDLAPESWSSQ